MLAKLVKTKIGEAWPQQSRHLIKLRLQDGMLKIVDLGSWNVDDPPQLDLLPKLAAFRLARRTIGK